jgi:hypothetical protein
MRACAGSNNCANLIAPTGCSAGLTSKERSGEGIISAQRNTLARRVVILRAVILSVFAKDDISGEER